MAAIKRFFQKRKMDLKFKTAGGGHRLTDDMSKDNVPTSSSMVPNQPRVPLSSSQKRAADAAMTRQLSGGGATKGG